MNIVEIDRTGREGDVITHTRHVPTHIADSLAAKWEKWDIAGPDGDVDPKFSTSYENEEGDEVDFQVDFRKAIDIRRR